MFRRMNDLQENVRRVIRDLDSIRRQLDERTEAQRGQPGLELDLLNDFKTAVDLARHTLWTHIEALSQRRGADIEQALQAIRMQRATDILRVLRQNAGEADLKMPEASTFLEEIQAIASRAVERHSGSES